MGPTASGKTDLAVRLSNHLPVEVINVDSCQVYRDMNIGTAKPDSAVLARLPHHLLSIRDPGESYSSAEFCRDALALITRITAGGRIPLLVGGSMLYFRALLYGLADLPAANPKIRMEIEEQAVNSGWPHLHKLLMEVDPATGAKLHPNHSQRISRALEVFKITGKPLSQFITDQRVKSDGNDRLSDSFRVVQLAITPSDRALLHSRIALRFRRMLAAGLVEEVNSLHLRDDLSLDLPAMRAVGYRQVWSYLDGKYSYDEMVDRSISATRQLAKRQLTWLRGWPASAGLQILPPAYATTENEIPPAAHGDEENLTMALKILEKAAIYA
jgi:tRNA dimethylallyltransferase